MTHQGKQQKTFAYVVTSELNFTLVSNKIFNFHRLCQSIGVAQHVFGLAVTFRQLVVIFVAPFIISTAWIHLYVKYLG